MNFEDACNELEASVEGVYKSTVKKICEQIIKDTPVDTGDLRGSWITSIGEPEITETPFNDPNGDFPIAENKAIVDRWSIRQPDDLFMSNGLPYSEKIEFDGEYNPEWQRPEGMVRVNLAQAQGIISELQTGTGRFL